MWKWCGVRIAGTTKLSLVLAVANVSLPIGIVGTEKGKTMNKPYIYYKEQCDFCINKGKCDYEKRTRKFVETISGVDALASGVFGSLSFRCDYFDLDQLAYNKANPPETIG